MSTEETPQEAARLLKAYEAKAYEAKKCRKALGRPNIKSRMSRKGKEAARSWGGIGG